MVTGDFSRKSPPCHSKPPVIPRKVHLYPTQLKQVTQSWLSIVQLLLLGLLCHQGDAAPTQLTRAHFTPRHHPLQLGVTFLRAADGKELFSIDSKTPMISASTTKLLTSIAALDHFGTGYSFDTVAYTDGKRQGNTLHGNLIIQGAGDPHLVNEELYEFSRQIYSTGIHTVTGDLIVDQDKFQTPSGNSLRPHTSKSSSHAYDAKVTAFATNFNTYSIHIQPGKVGKRAHAQLYPFALKRVRIKHNIHTHAHRTQLKASRTQLRDGGVEILVRGTISATDGPQFLYRSMGDPAWGAADTLRSHLEHAGVTISGKTRLGSKTPNASPLLTFNGKPVSQLVQSLNRYSNNFIADTLVHALGVQNHRSTTPSTFQRGLSTLNLFLTQKAKLPLQQPILSGSGLNPRNKIDAHSLALLLSYASQRWDIFPEFLASLPISGVSGTLKDRFDSSITHMLRGKVRAKTGTLTSPVMVSTLAGYLHTDKHGLVAFAILQNGNPQKPSTPISELHRSQEKGLAAAYRWL